MGFTETTVGFRAGLSDTVPSDGTWPVSDCRGLTLRLGASLELDCTACMLSLATHPRRQPPAWCEAYSGLQSPLGSATVCSLTLSKKPGRPGNTPQTYTRRCMLLFRAPARASGSWEGPLGCRPGPRTAGSCLHVRHGTCGGSQDVAACRSHSLQAASAEEQKALWAAGVRYKEFTAAATWPIRVGNPAVSNVGKTATNASSCFLSSSSESSNTMSIWHQAMSIKCSQVFLLSCI